MVTPTHKDIMTMNLMEVSVHITGMHKYVSTQGTKEMQVSMGEFLAKIAYMTHPSTINQLYMDELRKKRTIHVL